MKVSLVNNTIIHLLNFEKYSSFSQALKEAAIANDFQVVLMTEDFSPLVVVETKYEATVDDAISIGRTAALGLSEDYRLIEVRGIKTYWGTVLIENEKYYLFIVDNDDIYTSEDMTLVAQLIEIAMSMWKFTPERDAKTEFLKALMRGNKALAITLRDEAGVKDRDILSVFSAKGITTDVCLRIAKDFINTNLIRIIRIDDGSGGTKGIILRGDIPTPNEETTGKAVCLSLYDKLKAQKDVKIFHMTGLDGIEGAADGFRTISETRSFVEKIFPYKRVFSKYEMVLASDCTAIQVQGGNLKKNFTDLLSPFRRDGDNKSRQLLETLETFVLDAGLNASKTSEFMGIHTNTVQYRLKKINEILGVEITANRVIPGLTISLALRRIESVVK